MEARLSGVEGKVEDKDNVKVKENVKSKNPGTMKRADRERKEKKPKSKTQDIFNKTKKKLRQPQKRTPNGNSREWISTHTPLFIL